MKKQGRKLREKGGKKPGKEKREREREREMTISCIKPIKLKPILPITYHGYAPADLYCLFLGCWMLLVCCKGSLCLL
jgi:hypothetical protein